MDYLSLSKHSVTHFVKGSHIIVSFKMFTKFKLPELQGFAKQKFSRYFLSENLPVFLCVFNSKKAVIQKIHI